MNAGLLNHQLIEADFLREAQWAWSHGADQRDLGAGLLYYAIVYAMKARTAVCLGSGGGFVPRLMRQAQRDLGLAESSRTVLIDGNQPEAGWGAPDWLAPDSFFRTHFPDVEIIVDLTAQAARDYFAPQNLLIDYLHIDADHSFDGCLADFASYRPFLRTGSMVTLHDTNYAGAGVREVIEHLRTMPDCEVVDLPDWGTGLALVRIGEAAAPTRVSKSAGTINVLRSAEATPLAPSEKEWKYLESRAFSTRYALAAYFLKDCRSVIEIGGAKMPIDKFLTGAHDRVIALDPFIRESQFRLLSHGQDCVVSHVRARFQDVTWEIPPAADYGMALLGLEIQGMEPHHYETLYQLINQARICVIEFPTSWEPSRHQFELIRQHTRTKEVFQTKLDLTGNDFGNLENSWAPRCDREIHVLEPMD